MAYRTIRPKQDNQAKTATDAHITSYDPTKGKPNPPNPPAPRLTLDGLDGKAPNDPNASYGLSGQGTDTLDVTEINVGTGGQLNIRLESDVDPFPAVYVTWTPAADFGNVPPIQIAQAVTSTSQGSTAALDALQQIVTLATSARQAALSSEC